MEHTGGHIFNSKLALLKPNDEITIPFKKGVHDRPFKIVINTNENINEEKTANIIMKALKGCV